MFKIGKLEQVENEKSYKREVKIEQSGFINGKKETSKKVVYGFFNKGIIDGNSYELNFIINKKIEDYKKIELYKMIDIDDIIELYLKVNDDVYLPNTYDIKLLKMDKCLVFKVNIMTEVEDYYFLSEFEVDIN